jgi:3-hydroxy-3-methylglutaryl CoA synthase
VAGIIKCGAYIPLFRLGKETAGWNQDTEKAVANCDEDCITMAVAAALDCIGDMDRNSIDGLFFGTTTSPYAEKLGAATIALACDLRREIVTADYTNSLRAGTIALRAAVDAIDAGSLNSVMVVVGEHRIPMPGTEFEAFFADGAAAYLLGKADVAVTIRDQFSISDEILDIWRPWDEKFVYSWEDRFILAEGYFKVVSEGVSQFLGSRKLSIKDFAKLVFYAPDGRRHHEIAKMIGVGTDGQLQEPLFEILGNTGAAFAPMLLCSAMEAASPGEKILCANYGNGTDILILEATEKIGSVRGKKGMKGYLRRKKILSSYDKYLQWRGLANVRGGGRRPQPRPPSAASIWRERDDNIRFCGVKCCHCGYAQYPSQRVCTICHTKDQFERVRFSDKSAELFTYSMDYVTPHPNRPQVISVVNFDGGGRTILHMTDCEVSDVSIGMQLEMTFRKLHYLGGIHNYSWLCMPKRS